MQCGSVDARPDPGGGAGWRRAHVPVSVAWNGPRARGFSAVAARVRELGTPAPGPEGGARSPGVGRAEPRAGAGPRQLPGQVGSALAGEGGDALPARDQPSRSRGGGKARVSDAWVRQLRSQLLFLGSGTQRQTGSFGGSSRGSLWMLMGKEPPPLPSLSLSKRSPAALRGLRRGAPRANRGRRYLCSIRRDLGAGGTGPLRTQCCCCSRNFPLRQLGDCQAPLMQELRRVTLGFRLLLQRQICPGYRCIYPNFSLL